MGSVGITPQDRHKFSAGPGALSASRPMYQHNKNFNFWNVGVWLLTPAPPRRRRNKAGLQIREICDEVLAQTNGVWGLWPQPPEALAFAVLLSH